MIAPLRTLKPVDGRQGPYVVIAGKRYLDLCSNDYLGLSGHPALWAAAQQAWGTYGFGATGSRLLSGDTAVFHALETDVAQLKQTESALFLNAGFSANVGILSAIVGPSDLVLMDRLCHASIVDGVRLSGSRFLRFRHLDWAHLKSLLSIHRSESKRLLIVTESVFSMDGDISDLAELVRIKTHYGAELYVDESHATGVYGDNGAGMTAVYGVEKAVDWVMGTFGKALGGFGAYFAGPAVRREHLIQHCRSLIYATAVPPMIAAANRAALALLAQEPTHRQRLLETTQWFRNTLAERGIQALGSTPIVPIVLGTDERATAVANALCEAGFWARPIRYPSVPKDQARIRLTLNSLMPQEELGQLIDVLSAVL